MGVTAKRILVSLVITLVITSIVAGSDNSGLVVNTYKQDAISIATPKHWTLNQDTDQTRFGHWAVVFDTGEFSFFGLYVFYAEKGDPYDNVSLDYYLEKVLPRVVPEMTESDTKVSTTPLVLAGLSGKKIVVEGNFLGTINTEVLAFIVTKKDKKAIALFVSDEKDKENVFNHVESVLNSIAF
ncbi:MAG: hypothetical protein COA42_14215 [Alteromonadaceae bacterium]|nr:MAG: hypothetical protein COA42_14215 [Alteromonadaceae bacterium]